MGILTTIERRSSGLRNPQKWLRDVLTDSFESPSGVDVTANKALGVTAFWNGVRLISQTRASLPIHVYRRTATGREHDRNHAVEKLLNVRPNKFMTPYTFKEIRAAHELTWGNSYAEIERDRMGRPIALWPLMPDRTGVDIVDNEKMYWTMVNGQKVWLAADRVLHIPGLGFDGLRGYNVIKVHRESLGLTVAANQYGAQFFGNSGRPHGVLRHPGKPGKEERGEIKESWNQAHSGLSNAQRTALLWGGMEFQKISMNPEESQFLQTRVTQLEEVARILNINPVLLQHTQGATTWGTAIGQLLVAFSKFTIAPWVEREEDAIDYDLFNERERGEVFVKGNINAIMRGDPKAQAEILEIKRRNGVVNANEWRALDDENPIEGDEGNTYLIPVNYQSMSAARQERPQTDLALEAQQQADNEADRSMPESETPEGRATRINSRSRSMRERIRDSQFPVMEDGERRLLRREIQALERAIKRAFNGDDDPADSLNRWIDEFYPGQRQAIINTMKPVIESVARSIAEEASTEANGDPVDVEEFVSDFTGAMADRHVNSSVGQLRTIMEEADAEEMQDQLVKRSEEWEQTRAGKESSRELVAAATGAARYTWQQLGVTTMVWRANAGACPICQEMDGRTASTFGRFLASGDSVNAPDRTTLVVENNIVSPPLHQGCECDVVPG